MENSEQIKAILKELLQIAESVNVIVPKEQYSIFFKNPTEYIFDAYKDKSIYHKAYSQAFNLKNANYDGMRVRQLHNEYKQLTNK